MISQQRPRDFPGGFKIALKAADPEARLSELRALVTAELSYLETIQVDRALRDLMQTRHESHTIVRLAVLGATTTDHLLPAIRVAGLRRHLLIQVHAGQFGQYRQELLSSESPLASFQPAMLLLSLTCDELFANVPVSASREVADGAVRAVVSDLRELWATARERFGAVVIQQSFLDVAASLFGNHERLIPGAPGRLVARLNDELATAAADDGILFLDVARASARDGIDAWFDERHWLQGKMQIAPAAAGAYGDLLARLIGAQLGQSKKCLVLDLDNTLWGGVIGDDGLEGVRLGQGSAVGEAHLALQKYAKRLKDRGVVLAVCSKNEWSVVEEMFDRHPEMWLHKSDIAAFAVNWDDKADNLRAIARQLNIGLESLVFVDDNSAERARVREGLPMVAVPELPDDPAGYVRSIDEGGYFEAVALTNEDRERTAQYAANAERDALRGAARSIGDFLAGLEMSVGYGLVTRLDLARVTQLINKTNQFNTTTRRMSSEELARWIAAPTDIALQFRLEDRFGDNGLVSVMLFRQAHDDVLELVNWVMSCRVFGRQLEHEALNIAVEIARARGIRSFVAGYFPTAKNVVVANLYGNLGFRRLGQDAGADGASRWELELTDYKPHSTNIRRRPHAHE